MMLVAAWSVFIGAAFLAGAVARCTLKSLPLASAMVYLVLGFVIGPAGFGLLEIDLVRDAKLVEILTEIAVNLSLLAAGLELAPSWSQFRATALRLATVTMILTIALVALAGVYLLDLPLGAAVLLGAVLAPTDPVLADAVQVRDENDTDDLRYALTGEAGVNDGAAFPFVMLGLGLLGVHELGSYGVRWLAVDLVWGVAGGLGTGYLIGHGVSRLARWVARRSEHPAGTEEFLILAVLGLSYGTALAVSAYGFLAVFAAGVALRMAADASSDACEEDESLSTTIWRELIEINRQLGAIVEVAAVVLIGTLLANYMDLAQYWVPALLLFVAVRPLATAVGMLGSQASGVQRTLIAFFGIRGVGSLYYLTYAIGQGVPPELAERLSSIVVTLVSLSILVHSNPASTLFTMYRQRDG